MTYQNNLDCVLGEEGLCQHCGESLRPGVRRNCPKRLPTLGLGDFIEKGFSLLGVTKLVGKCGGCQRRKEKLNELGERLMG